MSEGDLEFRRDDKAWAEFRAEISRQLNERRPERIGIGETDWREPVYAWARNHMPDESHLIRHIAKREVDRCETEATKKGNKLIREWMHGLLPLDWSLVGPYPVKVGEVRVRLDVATPEDVEVAATELLAAGRQVFDEVLLLVEGLRFLAAEASKRGHGHVAELGSITPPQQEAG